MIVAGEAHLWSFPLEADPADLTLADHVLSPAELDRAARFVRSADRTRYLVAHLRLRQILALCLDIPTRSVDFVVGPWGKPSLAPPHDGLAFSLSHARELGLVAVSRHTALGVDVEDLARQADLAAIAKHFLSAEEQRQLACVPVESRTAAFFRLWTAKEALAKGIGDGLRLPFSSFTVQLDGEVLRLDWPADPVQAATWTLVPIDVGAGHAAALAANGPITRLVRHTLA